MPIVQINVTGTLSPATQQELMHFVADQICGNTCTLHKNIYVYIREWNAHDVRKTAPTMLIDWTQIPDRTPAVKKILMTAFTDKLTEVTGENRDEIVIIFTDIPLANAMLGGITREENSDW